MAARTQPTTRHAVADAAVTMTFERFLRANDGERAEWVDGRVVRMSPANDEHTTLGLFLSALLQHFVEARGLGRILAEPYVMRAGPSLPGRSPDILFVAREHEARIRTSFLDGPADLVVEIISPDSRVRDRRRKLREYEEGGIGEYWLPDPGRREAEFHVRGEDGKFKPSLVGPDGIFRSTVLPGLWLRIDWLWQRPPLLKVLKDWGLV